MPALRQRVKENSRLLPQEAIDIMTKWYDSHYTNPYPSFKDCEDLASAGKVSINQVKQWFVNIRRRTHNQFRKRRSNNTRKVSSQEDILKTLPLSSDDSGFSNNSNNSREESAKEATYSGQINNNSPNYNINNEYSFYNYSQNFMQNYSNNAYYMPRESSYQKFQSPRNVIPNYFHNTSTPNNAGTINKEYSNVFLNASCEFDRNYYFKQPVDLHNYV